MNSALSPREIQARLRAGASVPEVAADAGVDVDRIAGFAIPVMAERAHMTRTALASSVRRRGDSSGHRRLGEIIHDRLQARGLDADTVEWDSWRQNDLKWRLVGLLDDQAASRAAEFIFDPKGRFSVADNADARWMIGEELPSPQSDPDNENTIDFHDEFALVRAVSESPSPATPPPGPAPMGQPGDDIPPFDSLYETSAHTSELDELYDMLSGVSEDSVRVYLGLEDGEDESADEASGAKSADGSRDQDEAGALTGDSPPETGTGDDESEDQLADELSEHPDLSTIESASSDVVDPAETAPADSEPETPADGAPQDAAASQDAPRGSTNPSRVTPQQDPLVPEGPTPTPKRRPSRKRASVPSWDEIMFGGPTPS